MDTLLREIRNFTPKLQNSKIKSSAKFQRVVNAKVCKRKLIWKSQARGKNEIRSGGSKILKHEIATSRILSWTATTVKYREIDRLKITDNGGVKGKLRNFWG